MVFYSGHNNFNSCIFFSFFKIKILYVERCTKYTDHKKSPLGINAFLIVLTFTLGSLGERNSLVATCIGPVKEPELKVIARVTSELETIQHL